MKSQINKINLFHRIVLREMNFSPQNCGKINKIFICSHTRIFKQYTIVSHLIFSRLPNKTPLGELDA